MDTIALVCQCQEAAQRLKNAPAEDLKPKSKCALLCMYFPLIICSTTTADASDTSRIFKSADFIFVHYCTYPVPFGHQYIPIAPPAPIIQAIMSTTLLLVLTFALYSFFWTTFFTLFLHFFYVVNF